MVLRLQLDLPMFEESLPFKDLAAFVAHARAAGVEPDAAVLLKAEPNTTDIPSCLEVASDAAADGARAVTVDVNLLRWAVASIDAVTSADGDARGMLRDLLDLRGDLIDALFGTEAAADDEGSGDGVAPVRGLPSRPVPGT